MGTRGIVLVFFLGFVVDKVQPARCCLFRFDWPTDGASLGAGLPLALLIPFAEFSPQTGILILQLGHLNLLGQSNDTVH